MPAELFPNHREIIRRVTAHFQSDPACLALILGGSVMKGLARHDSDVDVMVIVSDEEYEARRLRRDILLDAPVLSAYAGGPVEGKYLTRQFLEQAAAHGSEPTRYSFVDAQVAFSRFADLERLLNRIVTYPEHERPAKIASFLGHAGVMYWYVKEAVRHSDAYLLAHAASALVLFAGRAILAHNGRLFPGHKWFMTEVRRAPDKPADFVGTLEMCLRAPGRETARAVFDSIVGFRDWGVTEKEAVAACIEDTERGWLNGRLALAEW
jgi:hypothetical protein